MANRDGSGARRERPVYLGLQTFELLTPALRNHLKTRPVLADKPTINYTPGGAHQCLTYSGRII